MWVVRAGIHCLVASEQEESADSLASAATAAAHMSIQLIVSFWATPLTFTVAVQMPVLEWDMVSKSCERLARPCR